MEELQRDALSLKAPDKHEFTPDHTMQTTEDTEDAEREFGFNGPMTRWPDDSMGIHLPTVA